MQVNIVRLNKLVHVRLICIQLMQYKLCNIVHVSLHSYTLHVEKVHPSIFD